MNIEIQLKNYILTKYKSIRAFTQKINIPYSTVDTMFKRGISGTGVNTVIKICQALSIDVESLLNGKIEVKKIVPITEDKDKKKQQLIDNYDKLNEEGQEKLLDYSDDLVMSQKYIKNNQHIVGIEA